MAALARLRWRLAATTWLILGVTLSYVAPAQPAWSQESAAVDEELARQQKVIERFVTVLEKNPRRGTALDRVYGFHVENGTLDALVQTYRDRTTKDAKDGNAWMVLGLVEAQRGRDAAAVEAFTKAVETQPQNAWAAYCLGQSLVLIGQPDKAVEAFELAISRKPPQNDSLEIFSALGRVHQRGQRTAQALDVWARLEKLFPNDPRVQEQIAGTLVEEGQPALALPRYETLVKITKDDYRKSVYRMEAAELKVKLNRSSEAISDLETLLASLNPTSWLHREVRRKIEEVFLRTEDQDGLARYYQTWLTKHPDDVDAMGRLAKLLARQARVPEAQVWLDKALKLAPSRKELRLAFIEQLIDDDRLPEAIAQYELLSKAEPNNPDYLREWGKLLLRDKTEVKEKRLVQAELVWRRLLASRPKDPLVAIQVADLLRHAELSDAALELYQKAVELAPDQPQYREYLGEFYHQTKRPQEAVATWRQIAAGKQRNATNVARLAEVLASFGYLTEALPEMKAACELDPKDISLHLKAADLWVKAEKYPEALTSLTAAEKLVQNADESATVLAEQIKIYQLDSSLAERAAALAEKIQKEQPAARDLFLLARYYETLREYPAALKAIEAAQQLEPQSIPTLATAARVYEQSGDLKTAADLNRKLATIDRRGRGDYLKHVAQLEMQLGHTDEALQAGRDLIASAPGNTESHEFYADLCFRLAKPDQGLDTLRRAVRMDPTNAPMVLKLATALAEQFRTAEAVELYWQAFDRSKSIDEKLNTVLKLAELHLQTNQFDRLLERLERVRRDADEKREMTLCLAQAHHSAGDFGMARQELESLLSDSTRDTQLFQQLSKLAESEGDLADAAKFQERLVKIAPGPETEYRLATLLSQSGARQESAAILVRLATREEDLEKLLRIVDSMLTSRQFETALMIIEAKLREEPANWELLYREGVARAGQPDLAKRSFESLLALKLDHDTPGIALKNRLLKAAQSKTPSATMVVTRSGANRLSYYYDIREAVGIGNDGYYSGRVATWTPPEYSQARMAALAWLHKFAMAEGKPETISERCKAAIADEKATPGQLWDAAYLLTVTADAYLRSANNAELRTIAKRLAAQGDSAGRYLYINQITSRAPTTSGGQRGGVNVPPLSKPELDLLLECYRELRKLPANGPTVNSNPALFGIATTLRELRRSGLREEEQQQFDEAIKTARLSSELSQLLLICAEREDLPNSLALFDRWIVAARQEPPPTRPSGAQYTATQLAQLAQSRADSLSRQASSNLGQLMGIRGAAKQQADVLMLLDKFLDFNQQNSLQKRAKPTARTRRTANQGSQYYLTVWYGKQQREIRTGYPLPNDYYDLGALQMLRNAFEIFRRHDLLSDLEQHLNKRLAALRAADKVYGHLALAYFHCWNENPTEAILQLSNASGLVPQDTALRFDVAGFQAEQQNFAEALAVVDGIQPLDQDTLREREVLAIDMAVRAGDSDRAKLAAERLFGLRLDADLQMTLASQMRRLGMQEQADAVLARAQRQAGKRVSTLTTLMHSHQANGKPEIAAQIAFQILRRSRSTGSTLPPGVRNADDYARTAALQVLGTSGKLKEMIAATEAQLARSPQATQLHEVLAEYYQASGDRNKALEWSAKVVEMRSDDLNLRSRYAQQLATAGKWAEAADQYKIIIKTQPRSIQNNYSQIAQAFRQAKKESELVEALQAIDLRQLGHYSYAVNLVSSLGGSSENRALTMGLYKKLWETFPEARQYLFSNFYNDEQWNTPELYEYAKKSLIPTDLQLLQDPWAGIGQISSYSGDGQAYTIFSSVLSKATAANELELLRKDIATAVERRPDWKGGPLLLAAIDARIGRIDESRQAVEAALESTDLIPSTACWIIGQELEAVEPLKATAMRLYERAVLDPDSTMVRQFEYSPGPRLLKLYAAAGRRDDALKLLSDAERERHEYQYEPDYAAYESIQRKTNLATQYEQLEAWPDALRLYREATNLAEQAGNSENYGPTITHYSQRAQRRADAILSTLAKSQSPVLWKAVLQLQSADGGRSRLNLMLNVRTSPEGFPVIDSQLLQLLTAKELSSTAQAAIQQELETLVAAHPDDINIRIAHCVWAVRRDPATAGAPLAELQQYVAKMPLDELAPGVKPNARQRAQAQQQTALWLAAQHAWPHPQLRAASEELGQRALQAAQREADRKYATAILFNLAQRAVDAGDNAAAEKQLLALLEFSLPPATSSKQPANKPKLSAPLTLSQFKLVSALGRFAAEKGFTSLAATATRESLRGGVPVEDAVVGLELSSRMTSRGITRVMTTSGEPASESQQMMQHVTSELLSLSNLWRSKQLPAHEIYDILREVVVPTERPTDVRLYQRPISDWRRPESLGCELARWAVAAKRVDELRAELDKRQTTPSNQLAVHVMKVLLAIDSDDPQAAIEPLRSIVKMLSAQAGQSSMDPAAHAAASAFLHPQLTVEAEPLLELMIKTPNDRYGANLHGAVQLLARHYAKGAHHAKIRTMLENFLAARQAFYAANDGEYVNYVQRQDIGQLVNSVAKGGDPTLTLEFLGRLLDIPATRYGDEDSSNLVRSPLWHLTWQLQNVPAPERYELLLKWTMPTAERRTIRFAAASLNAAPIPKVFIAREHDRLGATPAPGNASTFSLLIQAARDAGKLSELESAVDKAVAEKIPAAQTLKALLALSRQDEQTVAIAQQEADAIRTRLKSPQSDQPTYDSTARRWQDWLLLESMLARPSTRQTGWGLSLALLKESQEVARSSNLHRMLAQYSLAELSPADRDHLRSPGLRWWLPATGPDVFSSSQPAAWWTAHADQVAHITGFGNDDLFFKYPLQGAFEFSCEVQSHQAAHGDLAYGGLVASPYPQHNQLRIRSVSSQESVTRASTVAGSEWWNRYKVKVTPEAIRFYCNDHLLYEELEPSATSPWLHLVSNQRTNFRNFKLVGQPTIPRSVNLVEGDRMEGWSTQHDEKIAPRLIAREPAPKADINAFDEEEQLATRAPDWHAKEGVLHCRLAADSVRLADSRLYYHRPLSSGDTFSYEFLYQPGQIHVHPAIGRLAFLLEPAGVKLHWIQAPTDSADTLTVDRTVLVEEPQHRRGPAELPLRAGEWNSVRLKLNGQTASIALNGELIYERPLESVIDPRFGLFHFRDQTAVQVRKAVLTGDWPAELTASDANNLLALEKVENAQLASARQALVGEDRLSDNAYETWSESQKLSAEQRLALLREWVLPGPTHSNLRFQTAFTPLDQPAKDSAPAPAKLTGPRQHVGGEVVAPIIELLKFAAELKRLDELDAVVRAADKQAPLGERPLQAWATLLAIARQDDASSIAGLKALHELLLKLPAHASQHERAPEFAVVVAALDRPALVETALPVAELLVKNQQDHYVSVEWERRVRRLQAAARWKSDAILAALPMSAAPAKLTQWTPVSHPTAEARGRGIPAGAWRYERGQATFFTGNSDDALYFQSPLQGDFEVQCRRTTFGWKEIQLAYAGLAFDAKADGKGYSRNPLARTKKVTVLPTAIDNWGEQVDCRYVVKDGQLSVFFNTTKVHQEKLTANHDPWLAIRTAEPHFQGKVENVRILGQPSIPDEIKLSAASDLLAWRADYYGDSYDQDKALWTKKDDEIVGSLHEHAPDSRRESVLHYHRPLLEDGELQYEFYYEQGKSEVHPALDRTALLLTPGGVQLHYLTDGGYERSGLASNNVSPLASSVKTLALRDKQWHTIKLTLAGDMLSIALDGKEIGEMKLEPTNQRLFGLFRYSDATACRVKNVTYRGNWPKQLPPVARQELAAPE